MGRTVRMAEVACGERRGPYLVFTDEDGVRHAVRLTSVIAASDQDSTRDATLLQLPGNRFIVVRVGLDDTLDWLSCGWR